MLSESLVDVDGVVLVRLLTRPKDFAIGKLAADLQSILWLSDRPAARKVAQESIVRLTKAGHIWPDTKYILTDEGTAAALDRLGLSSLPQRQRLDWKRAKKLLLVRHFRLTSGAEGNAGRSDHLAAWIIAYKEKLQLGTTPTPAAVLQALAWRALGLPDNGPLRGNAAVGALLSATRPGIQQESAAVAPKLEAAPREVSRPEPKSAAAAQPTPPASDDLIAFSRRINQLALSAKEGTWTGNKVYIAQVWRDFEPEPGTAKPTLDAFKRRLVAAARAGQILLSRADLIGAYPQDALRESQIEAGGEFYHFVETQHLR